MQTEGYPQASGFRKVVDEARIQAAVRRLAADIAGDHAGAGPLVILAVLKGAVVFLADLIRHLPMPLEIELLNARSYRGTERQPVVRILEDVAELRLQSRDVLLLDCVLDSGHTLAAVRRKIADQAPASLKTCVLLRKKRPVLGRIEPEYVGVDVPDVFIVGYGLDHRNRWRHLPYVAELPAELAEG